MFSTSTSAGDAAEIRAVVSGFNEAASQRDGGILCRKVLAPGTAFGSSQTCAHRFTRVIHAHPGDWQRLQVVGPIRIHGHSAQTRVRQGGRHLVAHFAFRHGRWRMQVFD